MARARNSGDRKLELKVLFEVTAAEISSRQYEDALRDLSSTRVLARELGQPAAEASAWYRTGMVLEQTGDAQGALAAYDNASDLAESRNDWLAALAYHGAGQALNSLGRHREARDRLEIAQAKLEISDSRQKPQLEARVLGNLGIAQSRVGEYPEALESLQSAGQAFEDIGASQELRITGLHSANTLCQLGRFRDAESTYRYVVMAATIAGDRKSEADALDGLGLLYQYQGAQARALDSLQQALAAHEEAGDNTGVANDLTNLAAVYRNLGDPGKARELLKAALRLYEREGLRSKQGFVLSNLGMLRLVSGDASGARRTLNQALEILSDCECPAQTAIAHEYMGRVHMSRPDLRKAGAEFRLALDAARAMHRPETIWRAEAGLGDVYKATGDLRSASGHYMAAVETIESTRNAFGDDSLREAYLYDKVQVYDSLIQVLLRLNDKYAALDSLDRRNRWTSSRQVAGSALQFESPARQALFERHRMLSARITSAQQNLAGTGKSSATRSGTLAAAATEARREYVAFLARMRAQDPVLFNSVATGTTEVKALAADLPTDTAIIAYFMDGPDVSVFVLTRGALSVTRLADARGAVEQNLRRLRASVARPPTEETLRRNLDVFRSAAEALYSLLVEPVSGSVGSRARWYVLPDEGLWGLPFTALAARDGKNLKYLGQEHEITLVDTLDRAGPRPSMMANSRKRPHLAAFGNADGALPAAQKELQLVRQIDPRAAIVTGKDATEERFHETAAGATVLVFATHAARPPIGETAYIALAPGGSEDGRLTTAEIGSMDLSHVDLVVLSGCGTALSSEADRTFVSLSDAFLFAGAKAVMGTLWDISDPGTLGFVKRFVRNWKKTGDHGKALQMAQAECVRSSGDARRVAFVSGDLRNRYDSARNSGQGREQRVVFDVSHPYYWAPFVLVEYGVDARSGEHRDKF